MDFDVTEIEFDEVCLKINDVFVGLFSGSASIDMDGIVCDVTLDGWKDGKAVRTTVKVPYRCNGPSPHWDGNFIQHLAACIEEQCTHQITDALVEYRPEAAE